MGVAHTWGHITMVARSMLLMMAGAMSADAFVAPGVPGHAGLSLRSHRAVAHVLPKPRRAAPGRAAAPKMQLELAEQASTLLAAYPEGLVNGMTSYFNLFVPIFKGLNLPPFLLHWFHALNMGTVLVAMGGYGTALGWSMRNKPAEKFEPAPTFILPAGSNLGKTTSELHATLMSVMGLIFFLGANGGLVLSLVQDKPITESVRFTMLAIQGSLTKLFEGQNAQVARTAHAFFGTATMGLFLFHASQGLALGFALSKEAAPMVQAAASAAPNIVAAL